jgi:hypothetical protein
MDNFKKWSPEPFYTRCKHITFFRYKLSNQLHLSCRFDKAWHSKFHPRHYFGSRGSLSPSASSTITPRPILRLEGLAITFGIINDSASADTPARGARRHLRHHQRLRLGRYSGSRGSPSPSASSTTPPWPILQLEGLAVTFVIINDSASADTLARGARRHLRLQL